MHLKLEVTKYFVKAVDTELAALKLKDLPKFPGQSSVRGQHGSLDKLENKACRIFFKVQDAYLRLNRLTRNSRIRSLLDTNI